MSEEKTGAAKQGAAGCWFESLFRCWCLLSLRCLQTVPDKTIRIINKHVTKITIMTLMCFMCSRMASIQQSLQASTSPHSLFFKQACWAPPKESLKLHFLHAGELFTKYFHQSFSITDRDCLDLHTHLHQP